MTTAQILTAARELMLAQHGPDCADRPFWEQVARCLGEAQVRAQAFAEIHGVDVIDDRVIRALAIAVAYLDAASIHPTKEHAHG